MQQIKFRKIEGKRYPKPSDNAYVYIANVGPITKVGCTRKPSQRMETLRISSGFVFSNIYFSQSHYSAFQSEAEIHKILSNACICGEWFMATPDQIISLCNDVHTKTLNELVSSFFDSGKFRKIKPEEVIENLTDEMGVSK